MTERAGPSGGWSAAWASHTGGAHSRRGVGNQDAAVAVPLPGRCSGVVAAVADGHGGPAHVRADLGARMAVAVATTTVGEVLVPQLRAQPADVERFAGHVVVPELVERWTRAVRAHLAARPFTDDELAQGSALLRSDPLLAYGTTLLVTVCWDGGLLVMRLGDGDIVAVDGLGHTWEPLPRDDRLVGGLTQSLSLPDAAASFHVAQIGLASDVVLVLMATDGYANSFADADWQSTVGRDLLAMLSTDGPDRVASALPSWLAESAIVGGDDVTVVLLTRPPGS